MNAVKGSLLRALRSAVAIFLADAVAGQIWYAPIILAVSKALRVKFPQWTGWLPV